MCAIFANFCFRLSNCVINSLTSTPAVNTRSRRERRPSRPDSQSFADEAADETVVIRDFRSPPPAPPFQFTSRRPSNADLHFLAAALTRNPASASSTGPFDPPTKAQASYSRANPVEQGRDPTLDAILRSMDRLSTVLTDRIEQQSIMLARRDTADAQTIAAFIDRLERIERFESSSACAPAHQFPSSVAFVRQSSTAIGPAKLNTGSDVHSQSNSLPPERDERAQTTCALASLDRFFPFLFFGRKTSHPTRMFALLLFHFSPRCMPVPPRTLPRNRLTTKLF